MNFRGSLPLHAEDLEISTIQNGKVDSTIYIECSPPRANPYGNIL